jgi:hypothetical protein
MNDTKDRAGSANGSARQARERPRTAGRSYRRSGGLAVVVVATAIGLAACGSGSPDSRHVASLGTSTTTSSGQAGKSTTTAPKGGNATQLMDEWAACMRTHGDPDQTDPTIDQYGVINITMPVGIAQELSSEAHGTTGPCSQYELEAENVLRAANPVAPPPTQAQLVQYIDCMRTHGVPNYPNSGSNGEANFNGTGVDPNSPAVQNANNICGQQIKAPAWWIAGTGPPGDVVVTSAGLRPNGHPGGGAAPPSSGTGSGSDG